MPSYLLDASALCKRYFVNEIGAGVVSDLFDDASSRRYLINIGIVEVLNAFYRVCREGHLTETEREALIAAFYADIANGSLLVYSVRDEHILNAEPVLLALHAMRVRKKRPGPVDALVVACALDFDLADLVLVSSDTDLSSLAQQFSIKTFDPENPSG